MSVDPFKSTRDLVQKILLGLPRATHVADAEFCIKAAYSIKFVYQPLAVELTQPEYLVIVQTETSTGLCFAPRSIHIDSSLLGKDCRYLKDVDHHIWIAACDAAAGLYVNSEVNFELEGSLCHKLRRRTTIISDELSQLRIDLGKKNAEMVCVGAVGSILSQLQQLGWTPKVTDLNPSIVGSRVAGLLVEDGFEHTLNYVASADVALVTGMAFATGSMSAILETAHSSGTAVVVYAQTGANLAACLVPNLASVVIAEQFPLYLFPGKAGVRVYRSSPGI